MSIRCLTDERGVTLIELIVALGLTSLLVLFVISGVLFIERYIDRWKQRDQVAEDLAFVAATLTSHIQQSRLLHDYGDSLVFEGMDGRRTLFRRTSSGLYRAGQPLIRSGLRLGRLAIAPVQFSRLPEDTVTAAGRSGDITGLYHLVIVVSGPYAADTFTAIVRNDYEYCKFTP